MSDIEKLRSLTKDLQDMVVDAEILQMKILKMEDENRSLKEEVRKLTDQLDRAHRLWQDEKMEVKRLRQYYEPDNEDSGGLT